MEYIEPIEGEEWKSVGVWKGIDFTGYYEISNKGRCIALDRVVNRKNWYKQKRQGHLMNTYLDERGYPRLYLKKDGDRRDPRVHQLVALRFIPNPDPEHKTQVNHIDENKENNCVENLEWVTPKENCNWGTHAERCTRNMVAYQKARAIPVVQLTLDGEFVRVYDSYSATTKDGFCSGPVGACAKGLRHTSGGYRWMKLEDWERLQENNS